MPQVRSVAIAAACCALVCGSIGSQWSRAQADARVDLHEVRTAESDLEVRGPGKGRVEFVTRASLQALPQVEATLKPDEDFTELPREGVKVRGVLLETLKHALRREAESMAVEGICTDGYTAPFPGEYVTRHHPVLVLTVNGMTPKAYSETKHATDLGPYFIAYDNFAPAFHVRAHQDRQQVPVQLVRLQLVPERQMFAGMVPRRASDSDVMDGYRIAQQNCFRCHNAASHGGTKSGRSWQILAKDARERPEWFAKWIHDPQSLAASAEMPPNPRYDRATLTALTRYFSTIK